MAQVAGVTFMAIQNGDRDPAMVRQRFVALQTFVDMVNALSQSCGVDKGKHFSDIVGAGNGLPQPTAEETGLGGQFQSIETAHASPEQGGDGFGEAEDLLGIRDEAAENGQAFLARRRFHSSSETSSMRRCIS